MIAAIFALMTAGGPSLPLGLSESEMRVPRDNPTTPEKVELGRLLFFDKRLSADGTVACASCHDPKYAFAEPHAVSTGIKGQKGGRSAPSCVNRVFSTTQFWDGRAPTLEEQAKGPLVNPIEMGNPNHDAVVTRLRGIKGYVARFQKVFGTSEITIDHVAKAIAAFERTLVSGDSPYDRYDSGADPKALSASQQRGLELYRGKARCTLCHGGFNFTDEKFHNLGVGTEKKKPDAGRSAISKAAGEWGAFKTPSLREIALTAPYMHDGSLRTLEEVVDYYNRGGRHNRAIDKDLQPLKLTTQEKQDLVEFMKSLSGKGWQVTAPADFPQ